jgi:hypothetical protein
MMVPFSSRISVISNCCEYVCFLYLIGVYQAGAILDNLEGGILRSAPYRFHCLKKYNMHGWRSLGRGLMVWEATQRDLGRGEWVTRQDGEGGRNGMAVTT